MSNAEFVDQLLRQRALLQEQFAAVRADFDEQVKAIDVLLTAAQRERSVLQVAIPERTRDEEVARAMRGDIPRRVMQRRLSRISEEDMQKVKRASTRQQVRLVLQTVSGPARMNDVVALMLMISPDISEDSIRSVLQRMVHTGEAVRTGRGMYALRPDYTPSEQVEDPSLDFNAHIVEVEPG